MGKNECLLSIGTAGILEKASENEKNTAFTFCVHKNSDELHFMARLKKSVLKSLYMQTKGGSREAAHTVSMLYATGFGIEKNDNKALRWASFSLLEPTDITFEDACIDLKKDILREININPENDFVYPEFRKKVPLLLKEHVSHKTCGLNEIQTSFRKKGEHLLSFIPIPKGVPATFIYKVEGEDCHLYDSFIDMGQEEDHFSLDIASFLNIPRFLGELRRKRTIIDYPKRMSNKIDTLNYFAVKGIIAVPNSRKKLLKEKYPNVSNTRQMVSELMNSQKHIRSEFVDSVDEIEALKKQGAIIRKKAKRFYDKHKRNSKKLKSEYYGLLQQVKELIEKDKRDRELLESRFPEYFLKFLATEVIALTSNFEVHCMELEPMYQSIHCSSLGFITSDYFQTKGSLCRLESLNEARCKEYVSHVSKIRKDFDISGLLIQPNKRVCLSKRKNKQRYFYKVK